MIPLPALDKALPSTLRLHWSADETQQLEQLLVHSPAEQPCHISLKVEGFKLLTHLFNSQQFMVGLRNSNQKDLGTLNWGDIGIS